MELFARLIALLSTLWCNLPLILLAILGIGFVIMFHEFGHYLFAKFFNVYVPSFSIGFGPRILEKKVGETTFALSAIPLGGYVELAGSPELGQGEQLHAHTKDDRSFNAKPYWQKVLIMLGGILFNVLLAYLVLSFLFSLGGAPCIGGSWCEKQAPVVGAITKKGPAEKAQIQPGDTIVSVNSVPTPTIGSVVAALKPEIGKPAKLGLENAGTHREVEITAESQTTGSQTRPILGLAWQIKKMSLAKAFTTGWHATWGLITQTASAIKNLTKTREGIGGPLMLVCQVTQFAGMGLKMFLFMLAFISINLAVFNVLPLPIFDGGQFLFFTIEALIRRPLSDQARATIHYYTWLFVLGLVAYLTFKDAINISKWF
jgi:regulator of sigma E protease